MAENNIPIGQSVVPQAEQGTLIGPNSSSGDRLGALTGDGHSGVVKISVSSAIPRYWTMKRERFLYNIYHVMPELKMAVNNSVRHLTSIIPDVVPIDASSNREVLAAQMQDFILKRSWGEVRKMLRDFIIHDMGGYAEILSFYSPDEEDTIERKDGVTLVGELKPWQVPGSGGIYLSAAGIRALDPLRCEPTRDAEYPVTYKDERGRRYALHHTRVLRMTNLPSSVERLNGIGLSYISVALEEAVQVFHAQRVQNAILEGKPLKSIIFTAPWSGQTVRKQISEVYKLEQGLSFTPGGNDVIPIAVVGIPEQMHLSNNGNAVDSFTVEKLELERLPEGYEREPWSESLLRKLSAIIGLPVKFFGIEQKFSSRQDSESQSDATHNVAASTFTQFLETDLSSAFCTLNARMQTSYNDEVLEKRRQESRRTRAETYSINLSSGADDLESVLNDRLRHGDIAESDRDRILAVRAASSDNGDGADAKAIVDYNKLCGFSSDIESDEVDSEAHQKTLDEYSRGLRAIIRGVWRGEFEPNQAIDDMFILVSDHMRDAARVSARALGVELDELTDAENAMITSMIDVHADSIESIIDQAFEGSKANGGLLRPLLKRLEMWYPRYGELQSQISTSVGADLKFQWVYDPVKEHCSDCLKLNGRVARGSTWHDRGILPRSRRLECGGWRCGCSLEPTRERVTRGRWPRLSAF